MSSLSAVPVDNFSNVGRTEDGTHIVVLAHLAGRPTPLAIRREDILGLMALLSRGATMTGQAPDARNTCRRRTAPSSVRRRLLRRRTLSFTVTIPSNGRSSFSGEVRDPRRCPEALHQVV